MRIYKIYEISNEVNDKKYIGYSLKCNLNDRLKEHISLSKKPYNRNKLYKEMNEIGTDKFNIKIIEEMKTDCVEEVYSIEKRYIEKYKPKLNYRGIEKVYMCDICNIKYKNNCSLSCHLKSKKHNRHINTLKILNGENTFYNL